MHKIDDLLKWIELRPCMYIGEYKFENLYHFLNGFLYDEVTWENIGSKCALAFYHFLIGEKSDIFRYSKKEISLHFTK